MIYDLVLQNRSYRRFDESYKITKTVLIELIELARLSPSGSNMQPLKYFISWEAEQNKRIFPHLYWARHLKDWKGPKHGEHPTAYIIVLGDTNIKKDFKHDPGIAAQTILLGATEMGIGGCMIGNLNRVELRKEFSIDITYEIILVISLGKPIENVVIENLEEENGNTKYWRDKNEVHHVPKRKIENLIINL